MPAPNYFADYTPLVTLANTYDAITDTTYPDETTRVAAKENLVAEMASYIQQNVPLVVGFYATTLGLRAGFARAAGNQGHPETIVFSLIHKIAESSGPTDYNLKNQVVRAWETLFERFPTHAIIGREAARDLRYLNDHADAPLISNIERMKSQLGIPDNLPA